MTTPEATLPNGFTVRLHPRVRRAPDGRLLVGGSPLRAIRLTESAHAYMPGDELTVADAPTATLACRLLDANVAFPVLQGPPSPDALTVVIPVRDRPEQLERALRSIGDAVRCIVVDDASSARAAVAQVATRHGADLVVLDHNVGPAVARNTGLANVRTPFVAFVDSDVTVSAATLLGLVGHFDDPRVSVVGPLVTGKVRSPAPRWFERYDERAGSLGLGDVPSVVRPGASVAWLPSACIVARTGDIRSVDGFAHDLRVGEDVDLVWRLARQGRIVRYDPSHVAHHDVRATVRTWLGRKFVYGTGGAKLAQRHGSHVAPAVLSPVMAGAALGVLARRTWSPVIAAAAIVHGARAVRHALPGPHAGPALPIDLACRGLGWAIRQESSLLLRHWWPATAAACMVSRRARRVTLSALLVDIAVGTYQHPRSNPVATACGRRLDDVAYGAGLWWGCLRSRHFTAIAPRWVVPARRRPVPGTSARTEHVTRGWRAG